MNYFKSEAIKINDEVVNIRRKLHMYPEVGMKEYRTSKFIKEFLKNEGIEFRSFSGTAVCGVIKGVKNEEVKRCIALRADMDGLPLKDNKKCEYASKIPGVMHACGHDAHMAILLGVAKILNCNKHLFSGVVKLIFEPAEETVGGARFMIEEGVLENPYVNAISGLHVEEGLECGKVMIRSGGVNAASNPFVIKIKGSGGHGAYPHETIDPIVIASEIVISIQGIVSREINTMNPVVISVGSINGGTTPNIIPDEVVIKGVVRTIAKEDRVFVKSRLEEVVKGICIAKRATYEIEIEESYPSLHNDKDMVELFREISKKLIGENNIVYQNKPKMGVESFSYFANERPSVFYFLGSGNKDKKAMFPAHSSLFDIDEESLSIGIALQCEIAVEYLTRS